MKYIILFLSFAFIFCQSKAQNLDSLKTALATEKNQTQKLIILGKIAEICDIKDIELYCNLSLEIIKNSTADLKNNKTTLEEEARAYNNLSYYFQQISLYSKAEDLAMKSVLILEKNKLDTSLLVSSYNNLGTTYVGLNNYRKAISIFNKNIVYDLLKTDKAYIALDYTNLSTAYSFIGNTDSAIYYAKQSVLIKEAAGEDPSLINSYKLLGSLYYGQNNTDSASYFINKGYNLAFILNHKPSFSGMYYWKAMVEKSIGNTKLAEEYYLKSLQYQNESGNLTLNAQTHFELFKLYEGIKDYTKALYHFKSYKQFEDSANSVSNNNASNLKQVKFEYTLKENDLLDKQEKEKALAAEKQQKQQLIILFISIGIIASIVFLIFTLNRARLLKKQKNFISEQQVELLQKNDLLDKKNKTIAENISYALDIQTSLMPTEEKISRQLNKDCFVLFQPKDVVSGDFYWTFSKNNKQLVVLADCTGHGVTGAFISIMAIKSLEKVASETDLSNLDVILKKLHEDFLNTFGENINSDFGIELVMCCFDGDKVSITGSSNTVCIIENNELTTYTFDSISIGTKEAKLDTIKIEQIPSIKNKSIYMFTDGFMDQKGGPNNKRFLSKTLKNEFIAISNLPMSKQKEHLTATYYNWKGTNEQMDDVSIIGIK